MKEHYVYFYGSTKIVVGDDSLSKESIRSRNQIIGFEGIDIATNLIEYGEICFNKENSDGSKGETGTLFPQNITIVPFRYLYLEDLIIKHLEDVIDANENYIQADSIVFPLMMLKSATQEGYDKLGNDLKSIFFLEKEIEFKNKWCCYAHYYLYFLKKALQNKGYYTSSVSANEKFANLINTEFKKMDGTRLIIHADAGL